MKDRNASWRKFKLADVIDVKHGFAFKGEFFSEEPTADILLTPGNFQIGGGFKADKFKYYAGEYPKEYVLKADDIIITMTDLSKKGDTLGYPAKVPSSNGTRYLHNQRLGLVEIKSNEIDKDFLYWLLRTRGYQKFIVNSASGSTVKHTSPTRIQEYVFSAPSSHVEQRAIAKILSNLDEKIELNHRMNKTLESIAQAIFKRWFVDFEFPDGKGKPYKSSSGAMVESELGDVPEGWESARLGDVADVNWGDTKTTKASYIDDGFDAYSASGLDGKMTHYDYDQPGIVVSAIGAYCGATWLVYGKWSCIKNTIRILTVTKRASIEYIFLATRAKDFWPKRGSAQPFISQTDARNQRIAIPDIGLMEKFSYLCKGFFQATDDNRKQTILLAQIRDSLLPKLMSGKIRVGVQ